MWDWQRDFLASTWVRILQTIIGVDAAASTIAIPSFSAASIASGSASPTIITSLVVITTLVTATTHANYTTSVSITPLTGPTSTGAPTTVQSTVTSGVAPDFSTQSMPPKITSTTAFKAGVAAAVSVVCLLLVALVACFCLKRHRDWPWRTSEGVIPPFTDPDLEPLLYQAPEPYSHPYYRRSNDSRRSIIPDRNPLGQQQNMTSTPPLPGPSRGFAGPDPYNSGPSARTRQEHPLLSRGVEGASPPRDGWPFSYPDT